MREFDVTNRKGVLNVSVQWKFYYKTHSKNAHSKSPPTHPPTNSHSRTHTRMLSVRVVWYTTKLYDVYSNERGIQQLQSHAIPLSSSLSHFNINGAKQVRQQTSHLRRQMRINGDEVDVKLKIVEFLKVLTSS